MGSTDKLLQGLQDIKSSGDDSSKPTGNFFSLGEVAHRSKDFDKALKYYLKAADSGNSEAMFRLGKIYLECFGYHDYNVQYNSDSGIQWMKRAAKAGNIESMKYLADVYAFGFRDINSNFTEAIYWFKNAVEHGDDDALNKLMDYYWSKGSDNSNFMKEAITFYQSLADKGNVRGIERLADCYATGKGVPRNKYKAIELFKTAANFQSTYAMYWLGNIYAFGIDRNDNDIDIEEGIKWHEKAANLGLKESKGELADLMIQLAYSYSLKKDYSNAVKWFEKFGTNNLSGSQYGLYQFALAETYRHGMGNIWKMHASFEIDEDLKKTFAEIISCYAFALKYGYNKNDIKQNLNSMFYGLNNTKKLELIDLIKKLSIYVGNFNRIWYQEIIDMLE